MIDKIHLSTIKQNLKPDFLAGLSVSIVAIPQAMAYATIIGLPPHLGLLACFIPTIVAALTSSTPLLSVGPTAIISLITAGAVAGIGMQSPVQLIFVTSTLAFIAGITLLLLGYLKLGSLVSFIAHPVVIGFTNAAALIIAISQLPTLIGITQTAPPQLISQLTLLAQTHEVNLATAFVGFSALLAILVIKHLLPRFPAELAVILIAIIATMLFGPTGPLINPNLPIHFSLSFPDITYLLTHPNLITAGVIISLVAFLETSTIAKSINQSKNTIFKPNQELKSLGLANLTAGISGTFPVAGSFSRSALNHAAGGQTRLSSIFTGIFVIVSLLLFSSLLQFLPQTILAAIIISALTHLINLKPLQKLWHTHRHEAYVALATFLATLVFSPHLDYGIIVGIITAIIVHLHCQAHPRVEIFFCNDKKYLKKHHFHLNHYPTNKQVLGIAVDESLSFTNAQHLEEIILNAIKTHGKSEYILILGRGINHLDSSAEETLLELLTKLKKEGITLVFSGIKPAVKEQLEKAHLLEEIGQENVFNRTNTALAKINQRKNRAH